MQWINGYQHLAGIPRVGLSGPEPKAAGASSGTAFAEILAARINAASAASGGNEILSPEIVKLLAMILSRHLGDGFPGSLTSMEGYGASFHPTLPPPSPPPATVHEPPLPTPVSAPKSVAPEASSPVAAQPEPHPDIRAMIDKTASRYQLDPALVSSVIQTESSFDPKAVSHAGAQGLMQLMPETAQALNVSDPFDPAQNIDGGCRYLSRLIKRYHGDTKLALAAYNWGMGNLEKHPEKLPTETRNYVANVMRRWDQQRTAVA